MLDANSVKWLSRAVNTYVDENRQDTQMYAEGEIIDMAKAQEWVEVRLTGPRYKQLSNNVEHYELDVNLMISVKLDQKNLYRPQELSGYFASKLQAAIPVFNDSNQPIGCLTLRDDVNPAIDVIQWGVIDATTNVFQITIDGFYQMET